MKKLKKYWIVAFFVFAGLLQSCDDDEGYSIGDIANDWERLYLKKSETAQRYSKPRTTKSIIDSKWTMQGQPVTD